MAGTPATVHLCKTKGKYLLTYKVSGIFIFHSRLGVIGTVSFFGRYSVNYNRQLVISSSNCDYRLQTSLIDCCKKYFFFFSNVNKIGFENLCVVPSVMLIFLMKTARN